MMLYSIVKEQNVFEHFQISEKTTTKNNPQTNKKQISVGEREIVTSLN